MTASIRSSKDADSQDKTDDSLNQEEGSPPEILDSKTPARRRLDSWLNKNMRIEMTDGRILIGIFLCTDKDRNVILGSCAEYLPCDKLLGVPLRPGIFRKTSSISDFRAGLVVISINFFLVVMIGWYSGGASYTRISYGSWPPHYFN